MLSGMKDVIVTLANEAGVSFNSLRKWRQRNGVPYRYRPQLLLLAAKKGIEIDLADLEWGAYGSRAATAKGRSKKRRAA